MVNDTVLLLLAGGVYLILLIRHFIQRRRLEEHVIFTVFFFYLVGLIAVCFFPIPIQRSLLLAMQQQPGHQSLVAWNPLKSLYLMFTRDQLQAIIYSVGGNLALLVPLGVLLPLISPGIRGRNAWIAGVGTSITIEALQLLLDIVFGYAYRSPGVDQVVLNAIGFGIGYLLIRRLNARTAVATYGWHARRVASR